MLEDENLVLLSASFSSLLKMCWRFPLRLTDDELLSSCYVTFSFLSLSSSLHHEIILPLSHLLFSLIHPVHLETVKRGACTKKEVGFPSSAFLATFLINPETEKTLPHQQSTLSHSYSCFFIFSLLSSFPLLSTTWLTSIPSRSSFLLNFPFFLSFLLSFIGGHEHQVTKSLDGEDSKSG